MKEREKGKAKERKIVGKERVVVVTLEVTKDTNKRLLEISLNQKKNGKQFALINCELLLRISMHINQSQRRFVIP